MATNTRSPGQVVSSCASKIAGHTQSRMHDFLKLTIIVIHTWACQRNEKVLYIFNCHCKLGEKEARSLFAAQYWYRSCFWMSLSSESSVSNTIPQMFVVVNRFYQKKTLHFHFGCRFCKINAHTAVLWGFTHILLKFPHILGCCCTPASCASVHYPCFMYHCINYQRSKLGYRRKINSMLRHTSS